MSSREFNLAGQQYFFPELYEDELYVFPQPPTDPLLRRPSTLTPQLALDILTKYFEDVTPDQFLRDVEASAPDILQRSFFDEPTSLEPQSFILQNLDEY